jgi:ABC-2 type transport system ATP-binding protein
MSDLASHNKPKALVIEHVTKTYPNGFTAVKDLNFSVNQGEFLALIGPNGAGKSTTIGMICTLINITKGSISIFGHDLQKQPAIAKSQLGIVPQEINLNAFESCLNTLIYEAGYYGIPKETALPRAEMLLKQAHLWEKRDHMTRTLSGGMKRRLMIARSLIHQPKLLLLDEPTAGVDVEIRRDMWEVLNQLNSEGLTIILTTHYLEEAQQLCDRLAIIHHGRVHMDKPMDSLRADLSKEAFTFALQEPLEQCPDINGIECELIHAKELKVITNSKISLTELLAQLAKKGAIVSHVVSTQNYVEEMLLNVMNQPKEEVQ